LPIRQRDKLIIIDVKLVDDHYGVIVSCKSGHSRFDIPLADIAAVDKNSDNARHIHDYRVWFANR
jgi:hypothetical protein